MISSTKPESPTGNLLAKRYELFFTPGEEKNRRLVAVNPYEVVAPKHNEFHQHFNTGQGEYRMLAFRGSGLRYGTGTAFNPALTAQDKDPHALAYKISYEKEDPAIQKSINRELEKNDVQLRLKPVEQSGG